MPGNNIRRLIAPAIVAVVLVIASCQSPEHKSHNHLTTASSPYLREHSDNPVDWYEWGDEALAKAKKENKPLLISIGYSACHWCHVMEKESFMDTAVARIMNENFISIKVDREERPDIDNIYVHACQILNNGEAGWPLNAFALPDGKPFFAGTYYSKENWISLLKKVTESYKHKNNKVVLQASALTYSMIDNDSLLLVGNSTKDDDGVQLYKDLFDELYSQLDHVNGGLKGTTKFPTPSVWEFLLQYYYLTNDKRALDATVNTIYKMALGGIYDHVAGGFARYSIDSLWRIPHFEKMLYDNAQLVSLYAHAYQLTKNEFFKQIISQTLDFVESKLASPAGGYYCSQNADTKDGEGQFYTWQSDELDKTLDKKEATIIREYYNISLAGNWEAGKNILYSDQEPLSFASANKIPAKDFTTLLNSSREKLFAARNKRPQPTVDEKVLTAWNALLIEAYADAFAAFGDNTLLEKAIHTATFLENTMTGADGHLWRTYKDGKTYIDAFLDDYALFSKACISLYEITFDRHWLSLAEKLVAYSISQYYDNEKNLFYYTAEGSAKLAVRKIEVINNVIPASNAVMGEVLFRLGTLLENEDYLQKSRLMVSKIAGKIGDNIAHSPEWGYFAGLVTHKNFEVAIMGDDAFRKNSELQKKYLPNCVFMGGKQEDLPLLENKLPAQGTLIYVCTNKTCRLPVSDVSKALQQIN